MKNIYLVEFSTSEYGGIVNVIAENDAEAIKLLSDKFCSNTDLISKAVVNSHRFALLSNQPSRIVSSFIIT